jgi:preprotein translocase subunit SecG
MHWTRREILFAGSTSMMDVIMFALGFVFFAVSIAYVYACEKL